MAQETSSRFPILINKMNRIAVITRTKNRPALLARCLTSLKQQNYKDFLWVIINDSGNINEVNKIDELAKISGIKTHVIHRKSSTGIAAAANNGILETNSEFIHIHDDDDTLHPDFYQETINFLDKNKNYMGVTSNTTRINEEVSDNFIKIKSRSKYSDIDSTIFLADLLWKNQFTTISFIYRRTAIDIIGIYDESLPVLDDWDFNIRFCEKFDIGVIPRALANYHFREISQAGSTAQTASAGSTLHQEYTAIIRNKMLRRDLEQGKFGIGTFMAIGRYHQLQNNSLKLINDKIEAGMLFRRLLKRLVTAIFPR